MELIVHFVFPLIIQTIPKEIVAIKTMSQIRQLFETSKKRFRANRIIAPTLNTNQIISN